jgi:hypothetical protein
MSDLQIILDNLDREEGGKIQKINIELFGDLVSIGSEKEELFSVTLIELQSVCSAFQEYLDRQKARDIRLT